MMLRRLGARVPVVLLPVVLAAAIGGLGPACGGPAPCTELDCDSEALVTYPPSLFAAGPTAYDLVLEGDTETVTARCLDLGAPEAAENPEGLQCDAQGFSLVGHPLANERELVVTVIILETDESISEPVRLEAIEQVTPNGPDCPPLCVIRNGQLREGVGS